MYLSLRYCLSSALRTSNLVGAIETGAQLQMTRSIASLSSQKGMVVQRLGDREPCSSTRLYSSSTGLSDATGVKAQVSSNTAREGISVPDKQVPPSGQVFFHPKHNMYVCWHPEVPFPYEMTKPIDITAPLAESNLKIQALTPVKEAFRQKHKRMMVQELIKLTYATKHRFFGMWGKSKRLVYKDIDKNKQKRYRKYL